MKYNEWCDIVKSFGCTIVERNEYADAYLYNSRISEFVPVKPAMLVNAYYYKKSNASANHVKLYQDPEFADFKFLFWDNYIFLYNEVALKKFMMKAIMRYEDAYKRNLRDKIENICKEKFTEDD